ncbi:MAG: hypothetical protein K2O09_01540 [Treponemataceae bacterium]|nr:hypothetical protein [Treponemataceae bacterium]
MKKLVNNVRVAELDGLSDTIVRLYRDSPAAARDAFVAATMGEVERLSADITTAILRDKARSTLEGADRERDKAITALGKALAGYAALPLPAKQATTAPLLAVYEKYARAGITKASYLSESSMTESLLEDLADESLAGNIAALEGVAEAVGVIRAAQDAFTAANDSYVAASGSKGATATSLKKPLLAAINEKLLPYLTAMQIADNADCAPFAAAVGAEVARLNEVVARRGRKGEAPPASVPGA